MTISFLPQSSTGGNDEADAGKLARFDFAGRLTARSVLARQVLSAGTHGPGGTSGELVLNRTEGGNAIILASNLSDERILQLPDENGTFATQTYVNDAAANAVVAAGYAAPVATGITPQYVNNESAYYNGLSRLVVLDSTMGTSELDLNTMPVGAVVAFAVHGFSSMVRLTSYYGPYIYEGLTHTYGTTVNFSAANSSALIARTGWDKFVIITCTPGTYLY